MKKMKKNLLLAAALSTTILGTSNTAQAVNFGRFGALVSAGFFATASAMKSGVDGVFGAGSRTDVSSHVVNVNNESVSTSHINNMTSTDANYTDFSAYNVNCSDAYPNFSSGVGEEVLYNVTGTNVTGTPENIDITAGVNESDITTGFNESVSNKTETPVETVELRKKERIDKQIARSNLRRAQKIEQKIIDKKAKEKKNKELKSEAFKRHIEENKKRQEENKKIQEALEEHMAELLAKDEKHKADLELKEALERVQKAEERAEKAERLAESEAQMADRKNKKEAAKAQREHKRAAKREEAIAKDVLDKNEELKNLNEELKNLHMLGEEQVEIETWEDWDEYNSDNPATHSNSTYASYYGSKKPTIKNLATIIAQAASKFTSTQESAQKLSGILLDVLGNAKGEVRRAAIKLFEELYSGNQEKIANARKSLLTALSKQKSSAMDQQKAFQELANLLKNDPNAHALLSDISDLFIQRDLSNASSSSDLTEGQKGDTASAENIGTSIDQASALVSERITGVAAGKAAGSSGVSSGDEDEKSRSYGTWIKGTLSKGSHKASGLSSGYNFNQKGITIGADTGDDHMVGVAYSFFNNNIKNKENSATKDDVSMHSATLYGKVAINDKLFITGQIQAGKANIKKSRSTGVDIAKAKTSARIFSDKIELGYIHNITPNIIMIPTIGLSHSEVTVKGYKETGSVLARSVGNIKSSRNSVIAGVSGHTKMNVKNLTLVPEIHAHVDYAMSTDISGTEATVIDGTTPVITPSGKIDKTKYKFGGSLKLLKSTSDMYEVSVGYDFGLSKKFKSHTGTLKLRVNF